MKTSIIIICLLIATPALAEWQDRDKALMGSYAVLSAIDAYQTAQIDKKGLSEGNPLLRDSEGHVSMSKVVGYKLASIAAVWLLAEYVPKYRTTILSVAVGIQGACVAWNLGF